MHETEFIPKLSFYLQKRLHPDLVLWSNSYRCVYVIELTVPWEEAIDEAYERKRLRYSDLAAQAEERGWTVLVCPVEVGCRGFVANSTIRLLKEVGIRGQAQRRSIKELATTAERSSHWLWLRRKEMAWGANVDNAPYSELSETRLYFTVMSLRMAPPLPLVFLLMIVASLTLMKLFSESAQWCRVAAGVGEERSEAVSYSNSDCLMDSRLCNQLFHASYVSGAFGTEWSVKYNQQKICALKGSTVFMNGTFTHPENHTVTKSFWTIDPVPGVEPTDLSKDPVYSGRVEFFTDKQKHFSLKLSDVMKKDEHRFCFRIITNEEKERWLGKPAVRLRVTELHVEAPEEVTEGETADLTCKTTCSLTDPTFIWYKNGRRLTTKTIKNKQLHLQTVSSEDAGSYSCAVGGSLHLHSTAHSLRVRYPPKSVSVSISPSGEIVEGSSVTLTCSSDGNPPVKIYTWFKEGGTSPVGSGQNYSIISITADHTGLYYCEAQNDHGALNGTVMVTLKRQNLFAVWIAVGVGSFVLLLITVLICIFRMKKTHETNHKKSKQDENIYTTVTHSTSRPVQAADSGADDAQYATIQKRNDQVTSNDQQGDPQYASVTFRHRTANTESPTQNVEDPSVIYSTVRKD
ncbi:hypothetical protein SRHO_G00179300 [Serrasalmus rhombeus]